MNLNKKPKFTTIVYFPNAIKKEYPNITNLSKFKIFLNEKYPNWVYFNLYDGHTKDFIEHIKK